MFEDLGTEARPLRASRLPALMRCPWSALMEMLAEEQGRDDRGQAADTGSAVHMAARAYHGPAGRDASIALAVMRQCLPKYPSADLGAAEQQFRRYVADPRNSGATIVLSEKEHKVEAAPGLWIQGTLDQVRRERVGLTVVDIKTGSSFEGPDMLNYHALQLMAYQVLASDILDQPVPSACILRTKDYLKARPGPVFWWAPWSLADARALLAEVAAEVEGIRRGRIRVTPTADGCRWCAGGGVANCLKRREQACRSARA